MSGCPEICSVAADTPPTAVPSTVAVTVMVETGVRFTQVVGALTLVTAGPFATQVPLSHASNPWQAGKHAPCGTTQSLRAGSQVAGNVHWLSSLHCPVGETEHAASRPAAVQRAKNRFIGSPE